MYVFTARGNRIPITQEYISDTLRRYEMLKSQGVNERGKRKYLATGEYNSPKWQACPNNRACPYIAAIIAHLDNEN